MKNVTHKIDLNALTIFGTAVILFPVELSE